MIRRPPRSTLFPTRRSSDLAKAVVPAMLERGVIINRTHETTLRFLPDRKSTRLNSSHEWISYAVFCLKKKKKNNTKHTTRKSEIKQIISVNHVQYSD